MGSDFKARVVLPLAICDWPGHRSEYKDIYTAKRTAMMHIAFC